MGWMSALIPFLSSLVPGAGTAATTAGAGAAAAAPAVAGTAASAVPAVAGTAAGAIPAVSGIAAPAVESMSGGVSGLGPLQSLWNSIQGLKAGLPGMGGSGAVQPIGTSAEALNPGNAMALSSGADPSLPSAPQTPGTPIQALNTPNPSPANQQAQAAGQAGLPTPTDDKASKLAMYATAMKALNNMGGGEGPPKPEASSFRASGGGGPGRGLGPSSVGPQLPPRGPVTSTGQFLLSPAGRAAMARLQQSMTPSLAA